MSQSSNIRMNYAEWRRITWFTKKNLLVNYTVDQDDNGDRFYYIYSTEPSTKITYFVKINSVDDADETTDFETLWKDRCNEPNGRLGFTIEEVTILLNSQQLIIRELRMTNKLLEKIAGSRISYKDIDLSADNDFHV